MPQPARGPDQLVPRGRPRELYAAASPDGADIKGDRVVADLVDPRTGGKTGIKLEIRNGGPATQFELVTASMYKDPDIFMGYINTDEAVKFAADQPTVAVMAPRETSPQIIMWDPATYPNVQKIADLKAPNVKVRYFKDATYMSYLTGSGILDPAQVDDSYDASLTPSSAPAARTPSRASPPPSRTCTRTRSPSGASRSSTSSSATPGTTTPRRWP